jgi:hypothetical protein
VQYARQDKEFGSADDQLVRHASAAYDEIDALVHAATACPMPASLVYDLLGNLHATVGKLPELLTQLNGGLQQSGVDPRSASGQQAARAIEAAESVAKELTRRLSDARTAVDHRQRAARLPAPGVERRG